MYYAPTYDHAYPRGRHAAVAMGASIWQTPGAVQTELDAINADVLAFSAEISAAVHAKKDPGAVVSGWWDDLKAGVLGIGPLKAEIDAELEAAKAQRARIAKAEAEPAPTTDPKQLALNNFYLSVWLPFLVNWQVFYEENKSWGANVWWNHAPEAEQFLDQLKELRSTAKKLGMHVLSPEPHSFGKSKLFDPAHNIFDSAAEAPGKVFDVARIATFVGLGLVGVVVVGSLVSNVRANRDPAMPYLALAGRRR